MSTFLYLIIGFLGAWALIGAAKIGMAKLLQRPADYYERGGKK